MAGEIASTFVRIRPNTAGFRSEAESGIKGALTGVGKIVGGIFAAQGLVTGIRDIANAASQHQAAFAVLDKTISDAGASTKVLGKNIETLLEKEARLKGFHDEELASSFTRLVSVSHDSATAFRQLGLAEDVARARHIDVATAALALARAEQGSTISLSRLGIIIPKVSSHVAALRHEHDIAVASGTKFTGQLGLQYKAALAAAAAADRQATKVSALTEVQKRFGGTASVFGKTSAGQFATLGQEIHQFEVALGAGLLPTLTSAAASLGGFLHQLTASGQAARVSKEVMAELGQVFHVVGQALQVIGPPALAVSHALAAITSSLGVPGLIVAVATYKGLGLALSGAGGAAARFRAVLAAGAAAQEAAAAGANSTVAAEHAYASAIRLGTAAQEASIGPTEASTAAINLNAAARGRAALVSIPSAIPPRAPSQGGINVDHSAQDAAIAVQAHAAALDIAERSTAKAAASENVLATATVKGTAANRANLVSSRQAAAGQAELGAATVRTSALQIIAARESEAASRLGTTLVTDQRRAEALRAAVDKTRLAEMAASQAWNPPQTQRVGPTAEFQAAQTKILADATARYRAEWATLGQVQGAAGAAAIKASEGEQILTGAVAKNTAESAANIAATDGAAASQLRLGAAGATTAAKLNGASNAISTGFKVAATDLTTVSNSASKATGTFGGFNRAFVQSEATGRSFNNAFLGISENAAKSTPRLLSLAGAMGGLRAAGAAAGSGVKTLGSGILALVGGPTTLAIAGLAGLAFGIYKLVTQENAAQISADHFRASLVALADATAVAKSSVKQYGDALSSIKTDKIAAVSALLALDQARQQLASTGAARGSLAYREALQAVASAQDGYRLALRQVSIDEKAAAEAHGARARDFAKAEGLRRKSLQDSLDFLNKSSTATTGFLGKLEQFGKHLGPFSGLLSGLGKSSVGLSINTTPSQEQAAERFAAGLHKSSEALKEQHPFLARQVEDLALVTRALKNTPSAHVIEVLIKTGSARDAIRQLVLEQAKLAPSVSSFVQKLRTESAAIASSDPSLSRRIKLLADYAAAVRQFPDGHTTTLVLNAPSFRAATRALIAELKIMDRQAILEGNKAAKDYAEAFIKELNAELGASIVGALVAKIDAARAAGKGLAGETSKEINTSLRLVDKEISQTQSTIRTATQTLATAQQALADAIRTGNQQIHDSIVSADANLASIGDSISNMLGQFLDAQQKAGLGADISEKEFRRLRAKLEAGNGGVGTQTAAEQVAFQVEKGQAAATAGLQDQKDKATRGIRDLVDEFEKGKISIHQLNKGIAAILASDGFTYRRAGKLLGSYFVTGFKDAIVGIAEQAKAIAAVPASLRKGLNGQQPNIVRPLDTIHQVSESVAKAERERSKDAKLLATATARYAAERKQQHALTNELLRRRDDHAASVQAAPGNLRVDLAAARKAHGLISKADLNDIIKEATLAGIAVPQGLVAGIRKGGPHAAQEVRTLANTLLAELKEKGLTVRQVSEQVAKERSKNAKALSVAAPGKLRVQLRLALEHGSVTKSELNKIVREAELAGLAVPQGLVAGIRAGGPHAGAETRRLAQILLAELKAKLRARSPSEATREIGRDFGLGLALGISDARPRVLREAHILVADLLGATKVSHPAAKLSVQGGGLGTSTRGVELAINRSSAQLGRAISEEATSEVAVGREIVSELRAHRRSRGHGEDQLLGETRRQTHLLTEILAADRRKPAHPKPSKAPGDAARKARSAASHNLVS